MNYSKTYDLLDHAKAAIVSSGTATLETALFNVPEVVCYKGDPISVYIARQLGGEEGEENWESAGNISELRVYSWFIANPD